MESILAAADCCESRPTDPVELSAIVRAVPYYLANSRASSEEKETAAEELATLVERETYLQHRQGAATLIVGVLNAWPLDVATG